MLSNLIFWDVDTQYDFIHSDGKLYVPGSEEIVPTLKRLTDFARSAGIRVVASADDHKMSHQELSDEPDFKETFPPHCMHGTPGQMKIPETRQRDPIVIEPVALGEQEVTAVAKRDQNVLLHKHRFDVFSNPNTEILLQALNPEEVVLYGVALDVCNRFAVEGILSRKPEVTLTVVTDAVRAIDADAGAKLLEQWEQRGVALSTTEEVISRLQSAVST